jgi:preprotein translocase subunit SecE
MARVTDFPDDEGPVQEGVREIEKVAGEEERKAVKLTRIPGLGRLGEFYQEIKLELRKTTWPTRTEVWSTTVVVLIAVIFFGFYLFGVDWVVTQGFEYLERTLR